MIFRDNYGWPVELIIGKPITNLIRIFLHTNFYQTWKYRRARRKHGDHAIRRGDSYENSYYREQWDQHQQSWQSGLSHARAESAKEIAELKAQVEGMRNVLKSVSNFTYENQGHSDRACCSTEDGFQHAPDCEVMNAIAQEKQND